MVTGLGVGLAGALGGGLATGLGFLLTGSLVYGGEACIQHGVLRWLLYRAGAMPWNYARFLDYAAGRALLQKVGGGYRFLYPALYDYFADLPADEGGG
jgi:hypothetical protein